MLDASARARALGSVVRRIWSKMAVGSAGSVDPAFWRHRTTVAALLFKVMPIDGEIHDSEKARLNRILADEFSISEEDVATLVEEAQLEVDSAESISDLSKSLEAALSYNDKLNLISHMWEMVLADGKLHEYEMLLVERVASLLGVSPKAVSALMNSQGATLDE